ncbi:hypothetical protein LRS71_24530 [Rhodococcus pyridinivorans]|uniref:hypothetical protein n=1 Tax=Rhodococcus pyridinivorans TaxID=103816 RepID=UPI001E2B2168|nr:hypothetical protein [Rhodococcus pyridinivorans]MCD5422680.1 hypothetical protein [Rhodococcus pyridinivorans]
MSGGTVGGVLGKEIAAGLDQNPGRVSASASNAHLCSSRLIVYTTDRPPGRMVILLMRREQWMARSPRGRALGRRP